MDLDIWVWPDSENARRVFQALARFGAPLESLGVTIADFINPDNVAQFGRDSFIKNKRASGRKKDLADLESLGTD